MKQRFKTLLASGILAFALLSVAVAGQFEEGIAALQRGDFTAALGLLRPLAANGNADAQFNLGWMYANGKGVPQDYSEAVVWHRKAAEQENASSQSALGVMYGNGEGVQQDFGQAVTWTRKAAAQGIPGAQFNLGEAYAKGMGVPQNYGQAVIWYWKAAEQGHAGAQAALNRIPPAGNEEQQSEQFAVETAEGTTAEGSGYPGYPKATQVAIETAKSCDDDAALTYSQLNNESAETVARVSFEKCRELWSKADKIYVDEKNDLYGRVPQAKKRKPIYSYCPSRGY